MSKRAKRRAKSFLWPLLVLMVVLLVVLALVVLHLHKVHQAQNKSGNIPTSKKFLSGSQTSPPSSNNANQTSPSSSGNSESGSKVSSPATTTNSLATPFGTFVSNHHPGQNGSPTSEQSVCNTTPGATCDIQFKNNNGVVKDLGAQAVNSSGTAYWSWDVNGGTLAPGSWRITAVATLNGQTKTASDPTPLEVQ